MQVMYAIRSFLSPPSTPALITPAVVPHASEAKQAVSATRQATLTVAATGLVVLPHAVPAPHTPMLEAVPLPV